MDSKHSYAHVLEDFIWGHGAMKALHSDNAHEELSSLAKDIFKLHLICDSQSEAHYQHQNLAE